ncbi:transporter substrate-binding domain-containing protein [Agrobacterium rubi]|uniref:Transporter substrate-binding domain-containing protein n=1 Tax=Agrobacterium rubi TaxID=28099 RepID=A0AAE7USB6_9HYPH|nr:transporter substrate-binding domain-containing protein [Agrobacterium rubi]NTE88241.1 transporter substrate-binding domain-containing protein [Agrobacterium rubi]NTF04007.1 transporter substrate-binding domain-containing protein [Agrobacterium rubi]NTF38338.1 transporter substrate-binding domain-containing protein [Agrobacterium rubi]OCJ47030.1 ABC transporter substrate-binding protein [Agrobacterium rubi]QTG02156.1 transporter substrate-binding domain-containing protein [Agrobacterium rub
MKRRQFTKVLGLGAVAAGFGMSRPLFAASSLERIKSSGTLRIGGVADGAPYYQKSLMDGSWRGFYIDICQKLADDLGVKLSILETTWGNSVLDLQADKIDVFFGLNPTPERKKVIDFSGPVFKNAFTMIARKNVGGTSWDDFNKPDMRIAVDAGSSHDSAISRHAPLAQVSRLKTASDATAALQSGRADAQCLVMVLALTLRAKNPSIGELVMPTPADFTTSNAGFRREEDQSWREYTDTWITSQRESGFVKDAIIRNMGLVGVKESDFPPGFEI